MSRRYSPAGVLAKIPGWEGALINELTGGLTNRTWLAERDGRKAVLKIDQRPRPEPYNSRPTEASIQSIAASRGLASPVLFADEQVLLTEYVDGVVWDAGSLARGDNIELVASTLRRLHSLPLSGRSFDSTVAARRYVSRIENSDAALVAHCTGLIETMRQPHNLCLCHNDLVAGNIITAPHMMFLDWEYACDNDPMFDLATIVEHHELDEALAHRLLDAYFEGDGGRWRNKLREQQDLYLALYWLWLASRPGASEAQLEALTARITR